MGGPGSGKRPRDYPSEVVERIRHLYLDAGMTVAELQPLFKGYRVQTVIARYGIPTRKAAKRDQFGERNSTWRGSQATYGSLHFRLYRARGCPSLCEWCERTEGRFEWANLTGRYDDMNDYARLCVGCHRRYDADRRRRTGRRTMPKGGGADA